MGVGKLAATAALAAVLGLAGCGGGGSPQSSAAPADAATRRAALDSTEPITTSALFDWAERTYPSLFPAGPQNQTVSHEGRLYTIRYYPATGNYLGEADGSAYGLGPFTGGVLQGFGPVQGFRCEVLGQVCLDGVVAAPDALAGATVDVRCGAVSATTSSNAQGRYSIALDAASLPCVLRASTATTTLHGVAPGSGSGVRRTANLTPMTEAITAHLGGGSASAVSTAGAAPAALFDADAATRAAVVTNANAGQSSVAVVQTLRSAGADFGGIDFLAGALEPGAAGAHEQALRTLATRMQAGAIGQARLNDAITRTTAAARSSGVPSLPDALLLQPSADQCAALRSGAYRMVFGDIAQPTERWTVDARTLRVTDGAGQEFTLQASGRCGFLLPGDQRLDVGDAGVLVGTQRKADGSTRLLVGFPDQAIGVAELAGGWNSLFVQPTAGDGALHAASWTLDNAGRVTQHTYCGKEAGRSVADCVATGSAQFAAMGLSSDAGGGFTSMLGKPDTAVRTFAYRAGNGEMLLAMGGHLGLASRHRGAEMPAFNSQRAYRELGVNGQLRPTTPIDASARIAGVDAAAGLFVRDATYGSRTWSETFSLESPRTGYQRRVPALVNTQDGGVATVLELIGLDLRGSGLTVLAQPTTTLPGVAAEPAWLVWLTKSSAP